ncbi:hypothetical protein Mapa_010289 [Marchantia paleacea]|nr:hypothetical protein Mapa_010289 [Marchantia paleacea]
MERCVVVLSAVGDRMPSDLDPHQLLGLREVRGIDSEDFVPDRVARKQQRSGQVREYERNVGEESDERLPQLGECEEPRDVVLVAGPSQPWHRFQTLSGRRAEE